MLEPLYDRIVVEREVESETTQGGIYIPETAKEKPQRGTVIAVGDGYWEAGKLRPLTLRVGDVVLFNKYAGTDMDLDGREVLILRENEVLGRDV